jgi:hypothetical protein
VCLGLKEWGILTCYRHWEADADVRANPEEDRRASDDDAEEEGDQHDEEEGDSVEEDADYDNKEEDADNADCQVDEAPVDSAITTYARLMLEGIANNRLTQTGADFVLATMHDTLLPFMPPELRASMSHDWR